MRLTPAADVVRGLTLGAVLLVVCLTSVASAAQDAGQPAPAPLSMESVVSSGAPPAVLRFNNRPITTLRATVLSRTPAERAAGADVILERALSEGITGPIATRPFQGATIVSVGPRDIFGIVPQDVDQLTGETQESKVAEAVSNLQLAITEAEELRMPRRLLVSALIVLLATAVVLLLLRTLVRVRRHLAVRLQGSAQRRLEKLAAGDSQFVRASRAVDLLRRLLSLGFAIAALIVAYWWLQFVLRRFPYTRPWGESLRTFLIDRLATFGLHIVQTVPDLFTVLLVLFLTRFVARLSNHLFQAVEEGRIAIPYVYPETAQPTRRLVSILLWLLAVVVSYPYLPGSESDAFKGLSVFVGLVISLGSSGIVNQLMSGLTMTYSRAVRNGEFVRIGEVEGTVIQVGGLSTKIKTPRGEDVTIPNAVVVGQVTTNYSRHATEGVYVPTSITIGYDTPWRQVQALLLLAAERTAGVRTLPKPLVRQTALEDFYVHYTLLVCLEQPHLRSATLNALHQNILDAFNEFGVQITSPNYEADPEAPKVVPRDKWFSAPASPPD